MIPEEPGVTPISYKAQYIVCTYTFTDGRDMDTRTTIVNPPLGGFVGWGGVGSVTVNGHTYMTWGGDNTGVGQEAVYLDLLTYRVDYPNNPIITVTFACMWYGTVGVNPVNISVMLYNSGTIVQSGYNFTNPTAASSYSVASIGTVVTLSSQVTTNPGQFVAKLTYDTRTGIGYFINHP